MYRAGDCIFIETNYYQDGRSKAHLFVVLLDAFSSNDETIIVPIDKIPKKGFYDKTTILNIGDHDFIKEQSYINYNQGVIRKKAWLDNNARKRQPPFSDEIVKRICSGIQKSAHTPYDVMDMFSFRNLL